MTKQFQYDTQQHQEDCIGSIVAIFEQIAQNVPFADVMRQHMAAKDYPFDPRPTKNIDVMMETGTGKTFTFIKTMFELNRHFGYKKFIILIPSVAIRAGTISNLEDTKEYFKGIYANERNKEIDYFVYEAGKINTVGQYISNPDSFSVLVMTPSSFNSDNNLLNKPLERDINLFGEDGKAPKNYLECLKLLNPIIIMDEPHKFKGDAFLTYFEGFDNYFLRFGATFPKADKNDNRIIPLSNLAYTLDSVSAFRQNLVKKIVVYTQDIVQNKDSLVAIEKVGSKYKAAIDTLANDIVEKREVGAGGIFNGQGIKKINKDSIVLNDDSIIKVDYHLSDDAVRQMIRVAIGVHFEKEQTLFEQGIKALSLFFIESDISLFRGESPRIKTIFEEEYIAERKKIMAQNISSRYKAYLQNDFDGNGNLQVHKGYFSGDKKYASGAREADKQKMDVEEILQDKKRLLSFESPTRFIFSIWALQEGWDNPNVFTICKLSNQGSEISKLQQIGRGLRICVDQNLKRRTSREFGDNQDEFWQVNNLDVVVSSKEVGFVEAIQNEILSNSFFVNDTFTKQDLTKILKAKTKTKFSDKEILTLINTVVIGKQMVIFKKISDEGQEIYEKSPDYAAILAAILKEQNLPVEQYKALENLFASDIQQMVQYHKNVLPKKKLTVKQEHIEQFRQLWKNINRKAVYTIDNMSKENEDAIAKDIAAKINTLNITEILLQTIRAELHANKIGGNDAITTELKSAISYKSQVDYLELVQQLSSATRTPLSFVVNVFNKLDADFKQKMLCNNPRQAQAEICKIIQAHLVGDIKAKIRYEIMGHINTNPPTEFAAGSTGKYQEEINMLQGNFSLREQWLFQDVVEYDSNTEKKIITDDPKIDSIKIFGKLPRLEIDTPMGKYNPDFCYTIATQNGTQAVLIVEAKGYDTTQNIPTEEQNKISFAQKYFEKLNAAIPDVNIVYKTRINNTELATLINEAIGNRQALNNH
jgi:type III restriction enzyme